jgi:hypothetical protein
MQDNIERERQKQYTRQEHCPEAETTDNGRGFGHKNNLRQSQTKKHAKTTDK